MSDKRATEHLLQTLGERAEALDDPKLSAVARELRRRGNTTVHHDDLQLVLNAIADELRVNRASSRDAEFMTAWRRLEGALGATGAADAR